MDQQIPLRTHMKAVTDMREVNTRLRKQIKSAEETITRLNKAVSEASMIIEAIFAGDDSGAEIKGIAGAWLSQFGKEKVVEGKD